MSKKGSERIQICEVGCIILCLFLMLYYLLLAFGINFIHSVFVNSEPVSKDGIWCLFSWISGIAVCFFLFLIGTVMVYIGSSQLDLKLRIFATVFGFVPGINIILFFLVLWNAIEEISFERNRIKRDHLREEEEICHTKYPILFVHGVFFRDSNHLNYWGRIPDELIQNGATVFYGNHNSASSVSESAIELEQRILEICGQGYEKVNVIAHSKGGLDMRAVISDTSASEHIASLTTINTPHKGCLFADYLLSKVPQKEQKRIADTYNRVAEKFGDRNPDFLSAVYDLTTKNCEERGACSCQSIFIQSVGSKMNRPESGQFPLNFTYYLANHFDGPNDGLVSEQSCRYGDNFIFLTTNGKRGISHGDVIDLNRKNIKGFDVREFYVQLVHDLKIRGL